MECNKDDASKAKEIAERKLSENDFASAKKFALKAQALYPETDGLSQLIMTINVYLSAEKTVNNLVDWYGVLDITDPTNAIDETIRKQYLKLALIIHPDKNKSIGADGAFKLVLEAWSLLSDKSKRYAYDQRRTTTTTSCFQKNNINNFTKDSAKDIEEKFLTYCKACKAPWELDNKYRNTTISCYHCLQVYMAIRRSPPPPSANKIYNPRNKEAAEAAEIFLQNNLREFKERLKRAREEKEKKVGGRFKSMRP